MKKIVSSVLAASMVLSLAACGSTATTSESSSAASSEATSTASAATGESAGTGSYTGTPIKIGGIGPVTGAAAVYGTAVKNAEELAVKEINAANGSDVFEWQFEDDENDAEKSVNAYNTLKDWGMQILAGPCHHDSFCGCGFRDRERQHVHADSVRFFSVGHPE